MLLHVCASVSGLNPVSDFTGNKLARPRCCALALALVSQLPSAPGGFGGQAGWHCPPARPFFGHGGSDSDQRVLSMPGRG